MQSASYPATNATDGNDSTRWSSAFSDPQWIQVDLGSVQSICQVGLLWETAYGKAFQIQVSNDDSTWTSIYSTTTSTGGTQSLAVSGSGRYIRMYGTVRGTGYGYSLWEFEVFTGTATTTTSSSTTSTSTTSTSTTSTSTTSTSTTRPSTTTSSTTTPAGVDCSAQITEGVLNRTAWVASSNTNPSSSDAPANAIDGNLSTRFSSDSAGAPGMYWQADMGSAQTFNEVGMVVPNSSLDFARGYSIEVSDNGTTFTTVATCTSITDPELVSFPPQTAQYVRVVVTVASSSWWSVDELNLYSATGVPPAAPPTDTLTANANGSITLTWPPSEGATSYNVYRSTTEGGEGNTPLVSTTSTEYTDSNLSPNTVYFYEFAAVNSYGVSPRIVEDESMTPPPIGTGGDVPGVASGNSEVYYCKDGLLGGFDWFLALTGWFPQVLGSTGSITPGQQVVDMAYSTDASLTFNNVSVPTSGLYTIQWRYAYESGLFPGVNNRIMGVSVNNTVITNSERFPITGGFETYEYSSLQADLKAGVNSITLFAVSDHGISRVDQMTVTPATASVPSGPTNLTATPSSTSVTLNWSPSANGSPTSYSIFRGTISDGEAVTPIATVSGSTTSYTDTGLTTYQHYYYVVAATNSVGISPDSNETMTIPN